MNRLSLKKRLILTLHNQLKKTECKLHELTYLFWETTWRCNLNCIHCGSDCSKESTIPDMPAQDFLSVAQEISETYQASKIMIVITGGEALLRSDLEYIGTQLTQKGFSWGIVTNGLLLTPDRFKALRASGLKSVTISLDGLADSHNWLRNGNIYSSAIEAIALVANDKQILFDIVTCVNSKNIEELGEIKELLFSIGVQNWRLFTISPIGRAKNNKDLFLSNNQFRQLMEFITQQRKKKQLNVNYECEGFVGTYEMEVRENIYSCKAGINIASVLIDGTISACPNIDRAFSQGNIYTDKFIDIWETKFSVMRNRNWLKTGICSDCNVFKWCQGNGFHLRQHDSDDVLSCQYQMLQS